MSSLSLSVTSKYDRKLWNFVESDAVRSFSEFIFFVGEVAVTAAAEISDARGMRNRSSNCNWET